MRIEQFLARHRIAGFDRAVALSEAPRPRIVRLIDVQAPTAEAAKVISAEDCTSDRLEDPRVIAVVPMCDKGGTMTVQFTAPPPGDYPFFCSTPGHVVDMNGILHVTT